MNDQASVLKAIQGAKAVFGVTNCWSFPITILTVTNHCIVWEKGDPELETKQGKNLVDACKEAGVERFIWSSLPNVTEGNI
jgi:hypothetical protein